MRPLRGIGWKRLLLWAGVATVALLVLAQAVPYGRDHSNPPVRREPSWDTARTRELAVRTCFDCHSNETAWPWYTNVAPVSWLVQRDVMEGREALNFSEWDRPQEGSKAVEALVEGEMPPWQYTLIRSQARLSQAEEAELASGLRATLGGSGDGEQEDGEREDED